MAKTIPVSVKGVAAREIRADKKARDSVKGAGHSTADSFVNFAMKLGVGADNPLSGGGYAFNPITRVRTTLEWMHRGSWLAGVAVDVVADDMTRAGVTIKGQLDPGDTAKVTKIIKRLGVWKKINETIKWARLYGGAIAVMMIEGQDMETPLRLETIGKNQFKGLLVLDRWMVEPSLSNLVTEMGPDIGLPKFYTVTMDGPALRGMKIHHSRCMRLTGIELPYWQRIQDNLWGISVLERLYDRMIAFDSATTGAAQLVYKSYIRTYKIKDLRDIVAKGGPALAGLVAYVDMMRRFQGVEGITLLDDSDTFEATGGFSGFSGLSDALAQFGQQLSGALQIPLVRLFGQSPAGFSSGDTDLRMYYDGIKQKQEDMLGTGVDRIYRAAASSAGVKVDDDFETEFNSLWQLSDKEKAEIAETTSRAVGAMLEQAIIDDATAKKELKQSAKITNIFSNITDEDIEAAEAAPPPLPDDLPPSPEELKAGEKPGAEVEAPEQPRVTSTPAQKPKAKSPSGADRKVKDSIASVSAMKKIHDLDVVIENPKGSRREGGLGDKAWSVMMPADYGYIRVTEGADGDQVDCYIGPNPESGWAYVVNQKNLETGEFDEHKVMLGFPGAEEAIATYYDGYSDGRGMDRMMSIKGASIDQLKQWLSNPGARLTPF